MSILWWLAPVFAVTAFAALWTVWTNRRRRPRDMFSSVDAHRRDMQALARTTGSRGDNHREPDHHTAGSHREPD